MRRWAAPLAVAAAALAAFAPSLLNGFVSWDDPLYIVDNPGVRGLGLERARWALTTTTGGFWQPLSWLSLQLDWTLWGPNPSGFHLTSLLLHAASAVLFYFTALELLAGRRKAALLAALFFAVHPLRVESVAWAAERKGLLSGALFLAAGLAWLRGLPRASFAAFVLSLAAKPAGVALPLVLLIVEAWRARRMPTRRVLVSLGPFFAASAASAAATYFTARAAGIVVDVAPLGPAWLAGRVLYGFVFYPLATAWPSGLSPYYPPLAWFGRWSWELWACAAILAAASAAAWRARRARPAVAAVAAAYAATLLPMAGVVQQGLLYAACDRFSYLPMLGFALLFGAAFAGGGKAPTALAAVWLAALGAASWSQCAVWRDSAALWSVAAERTPSAVADSNLGAALWATGREDEGLALAEKAAAAGTEHALVYENLGVLLERRGQTERAREVWRRGLAAAPSPALSALLGRSLGDVSLLGHAVSMEPGRARWRADLADALARAGDADAAGRQYEAALALEPGLGRAHVNWGLSLQAAGRREEARAHFLAALFDPASRAQAHHDLGNMDRQDGRLPEAERHYREALRVEPGLAAAQVNLGNILARRGDFAPAAALYRAALKTEPGSVEARANLRAIGGLR